MTVTPWIPLCERLDWLLPFPIASYESTQEPFVRPGISLYTAITELPDWLFITFESGKPCLNAWRGFSWSNKPFSERSTKLKWRKSKLNYFPFGQQWYILERFPLRSQGSRFPLMEKGRMCLSRASQVSVQDTTFYGTHIPSLQSFQPL